MFLDTFSITKKHFSSLKLLVFVKTLTLHPLRNMIVSAKPKTLNQNVYLAGSLKGGKITDLTFKVLFSVDSKFLGNLPDATSSDFQQTELN